MHSLLVAALLASVTPSSSPNSLNWQSDYTAARELAASQNKPIVVFVASGADGWNQVVNGGKVDSHTLEILSKEYLCVYADRNTEMGAKMANALEVSGKGLVISDRGGKLQAFSHDGTMSTDQLDRMVMKYTDTKRSVMTTESIYGSGLVQTSYSMNNPTMNLTPGTVVMSSNGMTVQKAYDFIPPQMGMMPVQHAAPVYMPSSCANGRCGSSMGYVTPTMTYSSCPNGRCPK